MILIGVDDMGRTYTIRGFNGGSVTTIGRDIAKMKLVKIVHPPTKLETRLSNVAFGLAVTFAAFLMVFWMRGMFADLFIGAWKAFAGRGGM